MRGASAAVVGATLLLGPASAQRTKLTIQIEGVQPGGAVLVALFDAKDTWLEDSLAVHKAVLWPEAEARSVRWVIDDLPIAVYAARAYQDLDGDGELDKNRIGLPTEPFGFSNDAKPRLGPPGWRRAKFELPISSVPVRFELRGGWKKAEEIARAFERRYGKVEEVEPDSQSEAKPDSVSLPSGEPDPVSNSLGDSSRVPRATERSETPTETSAGRRVARPAPPPR